MPIQEELTRTIVSMTSGTLYGTMAMANSARVWVSSVTPSVSETFFNVGASMFGKYLSGNETPTPSGPGTSAEAGTGAAFYYYNVMHTIILLLTIWILFNLFSVVWRSVSVVWKTTVGICKILKFFASKLGFFTKGWSVTRFLRSEQPQEDETDTFLDHGRNSTTIDPPTTALAAAARSNANPTAKMQGYSPDQQTFVQSQFPPPPPPIGGVWFYHAGVTQNGQWLPPPTYAPITAGAAVGHGNGFPPQNPVFVPLPQAPVFETTQQNENGSNTNVENNMDSRIGNVQDPRPPQRAAAPNETCDNGNNAASDSEMRIVEEKPVANESNTVDGESTNGSVLVGANATTANAVGASAATTNVAVQETPSNSKKRKSPSESDESASDDDSMDSDGNSSMQSTESSESEGRPSKKQRREEPADSDAESANQQRALEKRLPIIDCNPETPEDMIEHLEANAARNNDLDEEEEILEE